METEQELNQVANRIKRLAEIRGINLSDPMHAFTVWVDYHRLSRAVYSGSRETHYDAWALAAEHAPTQTGNLYIAMGPLSNFGLMKFEKG
jgi:hypothetical protein